MTVHLLGNTGHPDSSMNTLREVGVSVTSGTGRWVMTMRRERVRELNRMVSDCNHNEAMVAFHLYVKGHAILCYAKKHFTSLIPPVLDAVSCLRFAIPVKVSRNLEMCLFFVLSYGIKFSFFLLQGNILKYTDPPLGS